MGIREKINFRVPISRKDRHNQCSLVGVTGKLRRASYAQKNGNRTCPSHKSGFTMSLCHPLHCTFFCPLIILFFKISLISNVCFHKCLHH